MAEITKDQLQARFRRVQPPGWVQTGDYAALALVAAVYVLGFFSHGFAEDRTARALGWCVCGLLGIWGAVGFGVGRWQRPAMRSARWILAALLVFLGWTGLQLVPLPSGLVTAISPAWRDIIASMRDGGFPAPAWIPIATAPEGAMRAWNQLFASVLLFAGVAPLAARRQGTLGLVIIVSLFTITESILALANYAFTSSIRAHGPVYNPNHHAAFVLMALPMMVAALQRWRVARHEADYREGRPVRHALQHPVVAIYGLVLLAFAGWAAGFSRGSLLFGGLVIAPWLGWEFFSRRRNEERHGGLAIAGAVLVIAVFVVFLGGFFARFQFEGGVQGVSRTAMWAAMLEGFGDAPIVGTGLGSTERIINRYIETPTVTTGVAAHSDPLQMLVEMGLAGGVLFAAAVIGAGRVAWKEWRARAVYFTQESGLLQRAALAGVAVALLHSTVDFFLRIPLVGFQFLILLALATGDGLYLLTGRTRR